MSELKVYVYYTGGTIGMGSSGSENPAKLEEFIKQLKLYPQLHAKSDDKGWIYLPSGSARGFPEPEQDLKYMIDGLKDPIESSNMKPQDWQDLARRIYDCYDDYDGFVILHGTDTMAFTSSALSFLLQGLKKPIILTGSKVPLFLNRNDAVDNILGSLLIAGYLSRAASIQQVCVFFNSKLFQGNRVVKQSTEHMDAFASPNKLPLLELNAQVKVNWDTKKADKSDLQIFTLKCTPDIRILQLFPGIDERYIASTLEGARAVILQTYGCGHIPGDDWFINLLRKASISGVLIINKSQCYRGAVHEDCQKLATAGVILGYDITMEAAIAKLAWVLNQSEDSGQRRELLKRNICGEMTVPL
ncbi:L-asparaginase 1-like [Pristis pectinata]|uniref:L-asparaginase 1-like n=1 Tax=Pristis pectinata TaxID=685728 RepID=UPI00223E02C8|nr:L-asparaginase 1-like [Pristis pectinata]XP_051871241.1 L-asparaginase 1-like [Pristis pectinata]